MEIILSKQCKFLCGSLGKGFGYHIQRRTDLDGKTRFWGVRQSKGEIPANGHLRFILTCAELAQMKLHIADICVSKDEMRSALIEAGKIDLWPALMHICESRGVKSDLLNAGDIFYFKNYCNL